MLKLYIKNYILKFMKRYVLRHASCKRGKRQVNVILKEEILTMAEILVQKK